MGECFSMDSDNSKGLISIIIPLYNGEKHIEECLDSVTSQTYKYIEVLVIDDGSLDNGAAVVEDYQSKDTRVKLLCKENGGVSSARNMGLKEAVGEYIMFLDCDDTLKNDCCEVLIKLITKQQSDLAACKFVYQTMSQGQVLKESSQIIEDKNIKTLPEFGESFQELFDNKVYLSVCAKLYKKDIIERGEILFQEGIAIGEDMLFNFEFFKQSVRVSVKNYAGYEYKINADEKSASSKSDKKKYDNAVFLYHKGIEFADKMDFLEKFEKTLIKYYLRSCFFQLEKEKKINKEIMSYLNNEITERAKSIAPKGDKEFLLYQLVCRTKSLLLVRGTVLARKIARKVMRG